MREPMTKVTCERCLRVDYVADPPPERTEPLFFLRFGGEKIEYTDICKTCDSTVRRAVAQIRRSGAKSAKKKRGAKKEPRVSADSKTRPG